MCSDDPDVTREWRVRNPNAFSVDVRWEVVGTEQSGTITAEPGDSFFTTNTVDGHNTTKIYWIDENQVEQDVVKASGGAKCPPPVVPIEKLNLTSMCSDDPDITREWRVRNPNNFSVNVRWEVVGTDQSGTITAEPGDSFFTTNTVDGANTTKIYWTDEYEVEQSVVKASGGAQCPTDDDDDDNNYKPPVKDDKDDDKDEPEEDNDEVIDDSEDENEPPVEDPEEPEEPEEPVEEDPVEEEPVGEPDEDPTEPQDPIEEEPEEVPDLPYTGGPIEPEFLLGGLGALMSLSGILVKRKRK